MDARLPSDFNRQSGIHSFTKVFRDFLTFRGLFDGKRPGRITVSFAPVPISDSHAFRLHGFQSHFNPQPICFSVASPTPSLGKACGSLHLKNPSLVPVKKMRARWRIELHFMVNGYCTYHEFTFRAGRRLSLPLPSLFNSSIMHPIFIVKSKTL